MFRAIAFVFVGFFWCLLPVAVFWYMPDLEEPVKEMIEYLCVWTACTTFFVGAGTFFRQPLITGKKVDGTFPTLYAVFWAPYIFFQLQLYIHIWFRRVLYPSVPIATKIHDGIYLSGWPQNVEVLPAELQGKEFLLVDMTCELPRMVGTPENYYNFPCWDGTGPAPEVFNLGVEEISKKRKETGKPLIIHCGFGRGRSLTFLLAVLVNLGLHDTWEEAFEHVKAKRSIVHIPRALRPLLIQWSDKRKASAGEAKLETETKKQK